MSGNRRQDEMIDNPNVRNLLLASLRAGATLKMAALAAGIDRVTLWRWIKRGKKAKSGKYRAFLRELIQASAMGGVRNVTCISRAAARDWRAAAWMLERRYPRDYGKREKVELTGKDGKPIQTQDVTFRAVFAEGGQLSMQGAGGTDEAKP